MFGRYLLTTAILNTHFLDLEATHSILLVLEITMSRLVSSLNVER